MDKVDGKDQIVPAHVAGHLLIRHTHLRHMTTFPDISCSYIYDQKAGHYRAFTEAQLRVIVYQLMSDMGLSHYLSHQYIVKVAANLVVLTGSLTQAKHCRNLVAFENGVLDLSTKQLQPHDPKLWVVYKLPYPYDLSAKAPHWEQYINHLCSGQVDRVEAIRSWLWCLVRGWENPSVKVLAHCNDGNVLLRTQSDVERIMG